MGLIKKQSISGTIYSYVGVVLGFLTTGLLFPRIFSTEEVGLMRILVSYSVLFAQFAGLGINSVTIKLFPYFRDYQKKHHGYLGLALLVSLVGLLIVVSAFLLFKPFILERAEKGADLFSQYFYYVVPLIVSTLIFNVFDTYYRVLYNAVKGIIYKEVVQRMLILSVILLYLFQVIDFHQTVVLYTIALILPTILLFFSLIYNGQFFIKPDFAFIDQKLRNELISVGLFGIIASFSGVLALNIDVIMIERMLGLSQAGIYTITFFFGSLILIPLRTMGKIGSVVIADAWKRNDLVTIGDIYKKSSISLSLVGLLLFVGIWGNIDNIFAMIKDDYLPGKMVIFYLGIANLFDISLGVAAQIIVNSKYYKNLSYFILAYAGLLVITNFIFIPIFGIVGAAIASLLSKIIFTFVKFVFLYSKYQLQPFSMKFIYLIVVGIASYWLSTLLPALPNFILDIIVRSLLITVLFMVPCYYLKISAEINHKIDEMLGMLIKR